MGTGPWAVEVVGLFGASWLHLTKEERFFASRSLSPALLHVEGSRVSVGAPLPALAPDGSRPGRVVPMFSIAQGRF